MPPRRDMLAALFPAAEVGGAERYVQTILAGAREHGWATVAAFPASEATAALRAELRAGGTRCLPLPIGVAPSTPGARSAVLHMLSELLRCWSIVWRLRPRATLLNLPHPDQSPGAVLACALAPGRRTAVVHLVPDDVVVSGGRRRLYGLARRLGLRWLTVAADSARRLEAAFGWPHGAIDWIPNGVAGVSAGEADRSVHRAALRAELGLAPDAAVLLTVARLSWQKGHDVLLDAIAQLGDDGARWVWAGDGDRRGALEAAIAAAGIGDRVILLGHRADAASLLLAADAFVLPSREEGMPFALLEAMAAGLPVIATALPGIAALIDDGVHGLLVAPGDPAALAGAMRAALADPARMRALADGARERVAERHSARAMVERTLAALGGG